MVDGLGADVSQVTVVPLVGAVELQAAIASPDHTKDAPRRGIETTQSRHSLEEWRASNLAPKLDFQLTIDSDVSVTIAHGIDKYTHTSQGHVIAHLV